MVSYTECSSELLNGQDVPSPGILDYLTPGLPNDLGYPNFRDIEQDFSAAAIRVFGAHVLISRSSAQGPTALLHSLNSLTDTLGFDFEAPSAADKVSARLCARYWDVSARAKRSSILTALTYSQEAAAGHRGRVGGDVLANAGGAVQAIVRAVEAFLGFEDRHLLSVNAYGLAKT